MTTPAGKRLWARVRGRVQGVGFRASALQVARSLDLAGWVRNLVSGEVELEAEGGAEALAQLVTFLRSGPRGARVDGLDIDWVEPVGLPRPFETRRTA